MNREYVRFEVLTAVVMKSSIFWDITPCSPLKFSRHFGGTYRLHLQGRRICQASLPSDFTLISCSAYSSTLKMFIRNVGWLPTGYKALSQRIVIFEPGRWSWLAARDPDLYRHSPKKTEENYDTTLKSVRTVGNPTGIRIVYSKNTSP
jgi:hypothetical protein